MPDASPEPENYSIDEMMDRLKNTQPDPAQGELVTRADGTVAIRVRKRKRRTSQPKREDTKQTRRARIIQVVLALVLIVVALLAISAGVIYANSSPFRTGLIEKIESTSGAKAKLQQFRMNPKTANAASLELEWPEGNLLKSLHLRTISAEIFPASFFGKSMVGEEMTAMQGDLVLRVPAPGTQDSHRTTLEGIPPIRFNRYRIPQLNITLGSPNAPALKIEKTEATLSTRNVLGPPQLTLYQGAISLADLPALRLDRALIITGEKDTEVLGLRVLHESDDRGAMEFSGTISPYSPTKSNRLAIKLDAFEISGITGSAMAALLSGRVDSPSEGSSYFAFRPTTQPSPVFEIAFTPALTSKLQLQRFSFLSTLSGVLDDPWFQQPVFEAGSSGTIHRENGVVSLRNLNFSNKGRMAIKGELSLAASGQLTGSFRLGIADAMVLTSKTARLKSMFGPPIDGYRWVSLTIGGTATAPTDDFKQQLVAAPAAEENPKESVDPAPSTFEELTRPR